MHRRYHLPLLLLPVIFGSCNHYYYAPNMHNVPLFREQGEVRVAVSAVTSDEMNGTDFQAAGSVTDHIGIMVNGMSVKNNNSDLNNTGRGHILEGGIGYFGKLDDKWVYELYGGYGRGKVENTYRAGSSSEMNISRAFVQPAVGYAQDVFDFGLSLRISALHFGNIDSTGVDPFDDQQDAEEIGNIIDNKNSVLFEPALHFRVGYKYAKFITQFSFSNNLSNPDLKQAKLVFGVGVQFHFAQYFMKSK